MRFDDRIETVLALPADRPDRLEAQWRQLVDLVAQPSAEEGSGAAWHAYARLRLIRARVDPALRRQSALSLAGRAIDPGLIAFFAEDRPTIAAPLMASAQLAPAEWFSVLPRLGPAARALLRHRDD